jgi:hypothetical protein
LVPLGQTQSVPSQVEPGRFAQLLPQLPQFADWVVLVSQPSFGSPSQSAQPGSQLGTQLPLVHCVVPLGLVHCFVQLPQADVDVSDVSHPLLGLLSQLPQPPLQLGWQTPPLQPVLPWLFVHSLPHDPQLFGSVALLTQTLLQEVVGFWHTQVPLF